jgi:hypothetical protein
MFARRLIKPPYLTLLSIAILILYIFLIFTILVVVTSAFILHRWSRASAEFQMKLKYQLSNLQMEACQPTDYACWMRRFVDDQVKKDVGV